MKKKLVVCFALLLCAVLLTVSLTACASEPTADDVKAAFEAEGYTVTSSTLSGYSSLSAVKGTDVFIAIFCKEKSEADTIKSVYDAAAALTGATCKQDGKNIYYGSATANAIYEKI